MQRGSPAPLYSAMPPLGPVVIITGAGSGIGRATAIDLSGRGCRIVLNGRREEALRETAAMLSTPWAVVAGDIGDPATSEHLIDEAVASFGRLDVVISNAGWAPCQPIEKHTPELIDRIFRTNALGPAYLFVAAWKHFHAQNKLDDAAGRTGPDQLPPCIVMISSVATIDPFPGLFGYAAAKASLNSMARSARAESKDLGIRCFVVAPGSVETAMLRGVIDTDLLPTDRTLRPESVAQVIAECVAGLHDDKIGQTVVVPSPTHAPPEPGGPEIPDT